MNFDFNCKPFLLHLEQKSLDYKRNCIYFASNIETLMGFCTHFNQTNFFLEFFLIFNPKLRAHNSQHLGHTHTHSYTHTRNHMGTTKRQKCRK